MDRLSVINPIRPLKLYYPTDSDYEAHNVKDSERSEFFLTKNPSILNYVMPNSKEKVLPKTQVKHYDTITGKKEPYTLDYRKSAAFIHFACLLCDFNSPLQVYAFKPDNDYGRAIVREAIHELRFKDDIAQYARKVSITDADWKALLDNGMSPLEHARALLVRREHPHFLKLMDNLFTYQQHVAFEAAYRRLDMMGRLYQVLDVTKLSEVIDKGKIFDVLKYLSAIEDEAHEKYQRMYATHLLRLSIEEDITKSFTSQSLTGRQSETPTPAAPVVRTPVSLQLATDDE